MLFLRALLSFLLLPGIIAVIIPPLIAAHDPTRGTTVMAGAVLMGIGFALLLWCVRDFYAAGKGTLAPWDPPKNLVTVGLYRYTRNPMYVAVLAVVGGWALYYQSLYLTAYVMLLAIGFHIRVVVAEEKWCADIFGDAWDQYAAQVSRWLPLKKGRA